MGNRLPNISGNHKICVICEGSEEYKYLCRLKELMVWNEKYDIEPVNAKGNGSVFSRYQDRYQNGSYEVVFVFCDTEKKKNKQYDVIKRKVNELHGVSDASDEVVIFGNPSTMQIILCHWVDVILKSPAKKVNAPIIEKCTGVKNYDAHEEQIDKVMACVSSENYTEMCGKIKKMSTNDTKIGSTNFAKLIRYFESEDSGWIDDINQRLDSEPFEQS